MKTISEMQSELKDISTRINALTKELSAYNSINSEKSNINFKGLKAIGNRHQIKGHQLARSNEEIKKHYITILISLVYLVTDNQENGWLFIQRISCGIGLKEELSQIAVDGLNLTEEQIEKFTEEILSSKLTNSLVLDCMLVYLSCKQKNKRMLEYMSGLFELVKCGKSELNEILQMAKVIATQDKKAYFKLTSKDLLINKMAYLCHTKELYK